MDESHNSNVIPRNRCLLLWKSTVDNDGDGKIDEDPWGDADGDGHVDDDGDCRALEAKYQDSNGDGKPCNPGDFGVDEDFMKLN